VRWLPDVGVLVALALPALAGCEDAPVQHPDAEEVGVLVAPVAVLDEARGDVRFRPVTTAAWVDVGTGQDLRPADSVQTMERASAAVRFVEGGAVARLGPSTTLRVPEQPPEVTRLAHLSGRLVARVDRESGRRMEVSLPPGTLVLEPGAAGEDDAVEARLHVASGRTEIAMVEGEAVLRRERGGELRVERESFVAVDDRGEVVDEGALGDPVILVSPAAEADVRTRRKVEFEWEPHPEAGAYRLEVIDSGGTSTAVEVTDRGTSLALDSGEYRWTVRGLIDSRPLPASEPRGLSVVVDRAPPRLELSHPTAGEAVRGAEVTVAGVTEPGAVLEVDGRRVSVQGDGSFRVQHPVPRGLVNLVVRVADDLGNARVVSRSVVRQ